MVLKTSSISKNLKSFTYTNAVTNGNFANGTTGWSGLNATVSASGGVLSVTGNGASANPRAYQNTAIVCSNNKKIFLMYKGSVTNAVCARFQCYIEGSGGGGNFASSFGITAINSPTQDTEYTYFGVATLNATFVGTLFVGPVHTYADAATANTKVLQTKEVLAIDLTSLYGAGNEPSATDCLNIFKFVDGTLQPNFSKTLAT